MRSTFLAKTIVATAFLLFCGLGHPFANGDTGQVGPPVILGDVDQNGVVNFLDIPPFIVILTTSNFQAEADVDQSGAVNFLDIAPFVEVLTSVSLPPSEIPLQIGTLRSTRKSICHRSTDGSGNRFHYFDRLSTGEWTYGTVFEADDNCNLIVPSVVVNDIGYAVAYRHEGSNLSTTGNWHLQTSDWTLVSMTPDGSQSAFVVEQFGFLLHPTTGVEKHARIDRKSTFSATGNVFEEISLTWLTDDNQMAYFNIGQIQTLPANQGIAQVGSQTILPFASGSPEDSFVGSDSQNWNAAHDWVVFTTTDGSRTVIRDRQLKVYPRTELGTVTRNTGDVDTGSWCWNFRKIPGYEGE